MQLEVMAHIADRKRRSARRIPMSRIRSFRQRRRRYHRTRPFCQDSSRSRRRNSSVISPEHRKAMINSAAYMLAYAAQPWAHCRYQPRPAFTPSISATTRTANEVPRPMNRPTKTCGIAAGMATLSTRKRWLAPNVYAGDTRPGEHRDREPGSERNQEYAGAIAGRENEESKRQPSCRRQRSDEPQDRMDP